MFWIGVLVGFIAFPTLFIVVLFIASLRKKPNGGYFG
ncbi:hypothetical protein SUNDANCE_143 [Brevibacillus phage Sundance]|nr:hypothetical protein AVT09_gp143 [Brevibacillus phage Sundance]ALA47959.1 hypothetical protein SUNDANCE_143 [Brevibacillus phage Sundance]